MATRAAKPCPPDKHGTASAYTYYRCRCETCKAGWAAYRAARREAGVDPRPRLTGLDRESWLASVRRSDWMSPETKELARRHRAVLSRTRLAMRDAWSLHAQTATADGSFGSLETIASEHDAWDDPTFDAVCERLDAEAAERRAEVAAWNGEHRQPRIYIDTTDLTKLPAVATGLRHSMSPRHRGRVERSAAALNNPGGRRKARKPKVAA